MFFCKISVYQLEKIERRQNLKFLWWILRRRYTLHLVTHWGSSAPGKFLVTLRVRQKGRLLDLTLYTIIHNKAFYRELLSTRPIFQKAHTWQAEPFHGDASYMYDKLTPALQDVIKHRSRIWVCIFVFFLL